MFYLICLFLELFVILIICFPHISDTFTFSFTEFGYYMGFTQLMAGKPSFFYGNLQVKSKNIAEIKLEICTITY